MIKRPDEIVEIIKKIDDAGYDVCYAGQCIVSALMGETPLDWDMYTDCPQEKIREMFPDGEVLGKRMTRLDQSTFVKSDDLNVADHYDGVVVDIVTLEGSLEDQLGLYDFTCEVTAERKNGSAVDPYKGREDIRKRLLKPVGDIGARMKKNPALIFKALRYVGLYGFDFSKELYDVTMANADRAQFADKEEILYEFILAISGSHAGKFLKMLKGLNLLDTVVGPDGISNNPRERKDYDGLCEGIDRTKRIPTRRLGLFYLVFDRKYEKALNHLPHDEETLMYLDDAKHVCPKLYFCGNEEKLKDFIYKVGWDKYNYVDKLLKAQSIAHGLETIKHEGRDAVLKQILRENQAIFEEDLKIDADDIIEAGITDDKERAQYLLSLLPAVIHRDPYKNDRDKLLKYARSFNKSKFRAALRDITWVR